jgi:hypothetical protein
LISPNYIKVADNVSSTPSSLLVMFFKSAALKGSSRTYDVSVTAGPGNAQKPETIFLEIIAIIKNFTIFMLVLHMHSFHCHCH